MIPRARGFKTRLPKCCWWIKKQHTGNTERIDKNSHNKNVTLPKPWIKILYSIKAILVEIFYISVFLIHFTIWWNKQFDLYTTFKNTPSTMSSISQVQLNEACPVTLHTLLCIVFFIGGRKTQSPDGTYFL